MDLMDERRDRSVSVSHLLFTETYAVPSASVSIFFAVQELGDFSSFHFSFSFLPLFLSQPHHTPVTAPPLSGKRERWSGDWGVIINYNKECICSVVRRSLISHENLTLTPFAPSQSPSKHQLAPFALLRKLCLHFLRCSVSFFALLRKLL